MSSECNPTQQAHDGVPRMAKKQRSLLLDEHLALLIEAVQNATGATFTRIITAAVIRYFFDEPAGSPRWMKIAMALERGDATVADIPLSLATALVFEYQREADLFKQAGIQPGDPALEDARAHLGAATESKRFWKMILKDAPDPLNAVITQVASHRT